MECLLLSKLLVEINAPLYSSRLSDDKNEWRTGDMQGGRLFVPRHTFEKSFSFTTLPGERIK